MYVIRRNGDGAFVAQPGSRASYTLYILNARKFDTKEAAEKDCCGNEHAVSVYDLMR